VLGIGANSFMGTQNMLCVIVCIVIDDVLGHILGLERRLESAGHLLQR